MPTLRFFLGTAILILTFHASRAVYRLYLHRRRFKTLPGPPHSWLFGHLVSYGKVTSKLPRLVHQHAVPTYLIEEYGLPSIFYIDLYPMSDSLMVICDPNAANHVTRIDSLPKWDGTRKFIYPISGHENIISSNGEIWKKWRSIFNPAFAPARMIEQVPAIVKCVQLYSSLLDAHARNKEVFRLEEDATRLTFDIVGKVVMDHDFESLTGENEFVTLLRTQVSWFLSPTTTNLVDVFNPVRKFMFKYYKRQMDKYIGRILDERVLARASSNSASKQEKTGLDLIIESYIEESSQATDAFVMSQDFRHHTINNMKLLMFAGHDTTASTICYCYYELSKRPEKLQRLRNELDTVFGTNPTNTAAAQLTQIPYLANRLKYTTAVIRETLRLWTPASSARWGKPGYTVRDPTTGMQLPTEGFLVWPASMAMHRSQRIWGADAWDFEPERFLPKNASSLPPHAYRPFEHGPRNCIGQGLAMQEMQIALALTVREYDFKPAYDEVASLQANSGLWKTAPGKTGPQECFGDEAYQILVAAAKPREGMPMRVVKRF